MKIRTVLLPMAFAAVLAAGVILGVMIAKTNTVTLSYKDNLADDVFSLIETEYVDTVDIKDLQVKAVTEILASLDPHSEYIAPEIFNEVNDPLLGSFEGIGVTFRIEQDTITIISTIKGGPSEKVGIMAGDRIVYIGDSLVAGVKMNNNDAMKFLKGPKNTKVDVQIHRRGVPNLLNFTITRDVIPTYSIDVSYMMDDKTAYLKLTKFSSTTHSEFVKAVKNLKEKGMEHLVLDLRDNSGGYLSAAVELADEMLPKGSLIVYTEGVHRPRSYVYAHRNGLLEDTDIVVLIDEGSASASEIVAGALQDNDRGTIVGRRSFGKGLVQEQFMLKDEAALRLTVARYYTPTGRCIQKPFDGDKEKYLFEAFSRYESGELFNADSIHFADTLRYITPKGKVVYGGGGIMPDIYVPLKNDSTEYLFNRIVNSSVLFQYAFEYSDLHRDAIKKQYGTIENFSMKFGLTDEMFDEILLRAEKKKITGSDKEKEVARHRSNIMFKAYVARNVFGDEAFYPLYAPIDEILQKAVEIIENGEN